MGKINFALLILCLPLLIDAQTDKSNKGVKFEKELSWEQIKAKAKVENKYIFLDCYASWCVPCKLMDKQVYTNDTVGYFFNEKFISVKVQMDTSNMDNDDVKKWYADAKNINQRFKLLGYPTFLFFSPDDKLINRGIGYQDVNAFMSLANLSFDPKRINYYAQIENYKKGIKDYSILPEVIKMTQELTGDDKLVNSMAQDYFNNYLYKLPEAKLFTEENIKFIRTFTTTSKEKGFSFFYKNEKKIDSIINNDKLQQVSGSMQIMRNKNYSQSFLDKIILKEEINSQLWRGDTPIVKRADWNRISAAIRKKYSQDYADRNILNAQLRWYYAKNDWHEYMKHMISKVERYGLDTAGLIGKIFVNNLVWEVIFLHVDDRKIINKGIQWMRMVIDAEPNNSAWIDTYANLLYKGGRTQDAITWEQKAIKLDEEKIENGIQVYNDNYHKLVLDKMQKGMPTWIKDLSQ